MYGLGMRRPAVCADVFSTVYAMFLPFRISWARAWILLGPPLFKREPSGVYSLLNWKRCERCLTVHGDQKFFIAPGISHAVLEEFHGLDRIHVGKMASEDPHPLERILAQKQIFFPRAAGLEVDGRPDASVGDLAVELHFHITGSLEFFKNDFVHFRSGVDQCRCKDR